MVVAMSRTGEWSKSFASASSDAMRFYDDIMVPRMFEPWAELLLDQLDLRAGEALVDVACGPGSVARRAAHRAGPSGRVTGCDLSPAMLGLARAKPSLEASAPIDYVECPADALGVADAAYDLATCQQGLQFFPDRPAALAEIRRALRPGGRVGIAVWCAIEECPPFAALEAALGKVLGSDTAAAYRAGPWGFPDGTELGRLVEQAGFAHVDVGKHQLPVVFDGGPMQLLNTLAAASVATRLAELDESHQRALVEAVEEAAAPLVQDGAVRSELTSHVVVAR